jgi:hypothetical protein
MARFLTPKIKNNKIGGAKVEENGVRWFQRNLIELTAQ